MRRSVAAVVVDSRVGVNWFDKGTETIGSYSYLNHRQDFIRMLCIQDAFLQLTLNSELSKQIFNLLNGMPLTR